jgi:hypothetical protein
MVYPDWLRKIGIDESRKIEPIFDEKSAEIIYHHVFSR